jgi:hypothetical protein
MKRTGISKTGGKTRSIQTVISGGDVYDPVLSEGYLKSVSVLFGMQIL